MVATTLIGVASRQLVTTVIRVGVPILFNEIQNYTYQKALKAGQDRLRGATQNKKTDNGKGRSKNVKYSRSKNLTRYRKSKYIQNRNYRRGRQKYKRSYIRNKRRFY